VAPTIGAPGEQKQQRQSKLQAGETPANRPGHKSKKLPAASLVDI